MPSGVNVPYLDATNVLGSTNMTMWRRDGGMEPMEFFYDGTELQIKYTVMDGNGVGAVTEEEVMSVRMGPGAAQNPARKTMMPS